MKVKGPYLLTFLWALSQIFIENSEILSAVRLFNPWFCCRCWFGHRLFFSSFSSSGGNMKRWTRRETSKTAINRPANWKSRRTNFWPFSDPWLAYNIHISLLLISFFLFFRRQFKWKSIYIKKEVQNIWNEKSIGLCKIVTLATWSFKIWA